MTQHTCAHSHSTSKYIEKEEGKITDRVRVQQQRLFRLCLDLFIPVGRPDAVTKLQWENPPGGGGSGGGGSSDMDLFGLRGDKRVFTRCGFSRRLLHFPNQWLVFFPPLDSLCWQCVCVCLCGVPGWKRGGVETGDATNFQGASATALVANRFCSRAQRSHLLLSGRKKVNGWRR